MERVIGQRRKGNPCYKSTKKLVELCYCPSVSWEVGHVSDDIGYLAEEVSKQSPEGMAWFLFAAHSKM